MIYINRNKRKAERYIMHLNFSPVSFAGKMFTTDLDGTMLIPANEHMKLNVEDRLYNGDSIEKTERAVQRNGIDSVLLNTGRTFTELKEIQDILRETTLPVTAISLEDGKRLLVKPDTMSSAEWLNTLFDQNINYLRFKDAGWTEKNEAPLKAIGDFLTGEKGFIHRNDKGEELIYSKPVQKSDTGVKSCSKDALWIVKVVPPAINFEVSVRGAGEADEIDIEAFNAELRNEILKMLDKKGYDIKTPETKKQYTCINTIERGDVSKGAVADYVRRQSNDTDCEIRAGNAGNDESMLKTSYPNTQSILVGNDNNMRKILARQANVTYVPAGELGRGIDAACRKLTLVA